MISHERYTELLSKRINRTITPSEEKDVAQFEAAQPKLCPKCQVAVWSPVAPSQMIYDIETCPGKKAVA